MAHEFSEQQAQRFEWLFFHVQYNVFIFRIAISCHVLGTMLGVAGFPILFYAPVKTCNYFI